MHTQTIGIDFGTTNSVVSVADPDGTTRTALFPWPLGPSETFRTLLCFWSERHTLHHASGPLAIDEYLKDTEGSRFIQSIKTYLGSTLFKETRLFGVRFELEDLIALFLRDLWSQAAEVLRLDADPRTYRVVSGRPVKFAGYDPDESLAVRRLAESYRRAGFGPVDFAYEPQGAAFTFAKRHHTSSHVLVADFGGGTSDFSVVRVEGATGDITPIAHAGIGIAGDVFDYRLIEHVVAPQLGKGSTYQSFGKTMDMPKGIYQSFSSWHLLSLMKTPKVLRDIRDILKTSSAPQQLEQLLAMIEGEMGLLLYRAISGVKAALSHDTEADFVFKAQGVSLQAPVTRRDFEGWIAHDVDQIRTCVLNVLRESQSAPRDIDHIFMTGGTSFVPAIRAMMADIFGADKLAGGGEFTSVSAGLALIGQTLQKG